MKKRIFDIIFTLPGLVILAPFFLWVALWIKLDSKGPVFFRQERVGLRGKTFRIYKFRTMVVEAERLGKQLTIGKDSRITKSGAFLRKYKLDELPQLINVLLGDMSLVGPRPEVPRYVKEYSPEDRKIVLSVRPGITDKASIEYKEENAILGKAANPEEEYIRVILPIKLSYYREYALNHTLAGDFMIICRTIFAILGLGK